jgi:hypothetical protein
VAGELRRADAYAVKFRRDFAIEADHTRGLRSAVDLLWMSQHLDVLRQLQLHLRRAWKG